MNKTLWQYYVDTAAQITDSALEEIISLEQWQDERSQRRDEFLRSMGIHNVPSCDLSVTCYGEFSGPGYHAYRLAYQLMPDVWGTGNLLLPDPLPPYPVPAVLYACGHSASAVGDTSFDTLPWPRRGFACFVFDTIAQTDNTGFHRGLAAGSRPDWISRGYTAAGGELLNGLRAFDVLYGRPEIDRHRIGVTGRSGGGAQSFFLAIAEERIQAAVPIVGVTSLKRTVSHRAYRHHCDCMYALSLYQRDNVDFGALIAPRPVLLCYGSQDSLYCAEEYHTMVEKIRRIYRLYGCEEHCQLLEYSGGHGDAEPAASATHHWFDAHLGAGQSTTKSQSVPFPVPSLSAEIDEPLGSVFNGQRPVPDRLDLLPELLTLSSSYPLPRDAEEWSAIRAHVVAHLKEHVFGWLDRASESAHIEHLCHNRHRGEIGGMEIWLETPMLPASVLIPDEEGSDRESSSAINRGRFPRLILAVCDLGQDIAALEQECLSYFPGDAVALLEPRGTGVNAPVLSQSTQGVQGLSGMQDVQRVGALLGLTLPLLWLNDIKHIIAYLRRLPDLGQLTLYLYGHGDAAVSCLYSAVLHPEIQGVIMVHPPDSHQNSGYLPAILREMDITAAVGLMAPRAVGIIARNRLSEWYQLRWGHRVYHRLGIPERHALAGSVPEVRDVVFQTAKYGTGDN